MLKLVICFISVFFTLNGFSKTDKDLLVNQIDSHVYQHISFQEIKNYGTVDANGLIVVDGKKAYLIDTPWSEKATSHLLKWLDNKGLTLQASFSTHFHEDSTAGIAFLNKQGIPTYTSTLTKKLLKNHNKATPSITFKGDEFSLNQGKIKIFYPGKGHSPDNSVVWLPKQNVLFVGCLIKGKEWTTIGNIADASLDDYIETIKQVKKKYPDNITIIPGHGLATDQQAFAHTIELVKKALSNK